MSVMLFWDENLPWWFGLVNLLLVLGLGVTGTAFICANWAHDSRTTRRLHYYG